MRVGMFIIGFLIFLLGIPLCAILIGFLMIPVGVIMMVVGLFTTKQSRSEKLEERLKEKRLRREIADERNR